MGYRSIKRVGVRKTNPIGDAAGMHGSDASHTGQEVDTPFSAAIGKAIKGMMGISPAVEAFGRAALTGQSIDEADTPANAVAGGAVAGPAASGDSSSQGGGETGDGNSSF